MKCLLKKKIKTVVIDPFVKRKGGGKKQTNVDDINYTNMSAQQRILNL